MNLRAVGPGRRIAGGMLAGLAFIAALDLSACHNPSDKPAGPATAAAPRPPPPPPPFTAEDAPLALEALRHAPEHGFPAARFPTDEIARRLASAEAADQAEGQRALRAAVIDYARLQHGLAIPVGALPREWNTRPSAYDAASELNAALRSGTVKTWIDGLPPQTPEYRALQAAYMATNDDQTVRARPALAAGPLDLGEQDSRSKALRARLSREDALAEHDADAPVNQDLIDRLKTYQRRHHLEETGALDDATAGLLNAPPVSKAARLRVNLERLRWLPRPTPARRIDVNIAAAEMEYVRAGEAPTRMLAVSGKLGDETPIVNSAIDSIVLDPPWYVPADIAAREITPKGEAYMQARHFVWRGGRVIQLPGPKTALGLVKFDFPNPYAVYLHDTPSKASFNQSRRAASHGCIRLQRAVELARILAAEEPGLSPERVDQILASGKTVRLKLTRPVPVRLMYLTAVPTGDTIAYPPDVYGWDAKLLALLDRYEARRRRR